MGTSVASFSAAPDFRAICGQFAFDGRWVDGRPHGNGHINDTYVVSFDQKGRRTRYVLQRINTRVFADVPALMENMVRVCAHVGARVAVDGDPEASRRSLRLVPTCSGASFYRDPAGGSWRAYHFIERAISFDKVQSPRQARAAAQAFGEFQQLLADFKPPRLRETIPFFHDTRRRYEALDRAIRADRVARAGRAAREIEFARRRENLADALHDLCARGEISERIAHNDTKLNNVLFDDVSGEALCVIDLDTVMPGLALCDFGDLARSATSAVDEDETDLSRVGLQLPIFAQLVEGYCAGAGALVGPAERGHLPLAARVLTFETGIRFLTDFLSGDVYYKTTRPEHNLDRARNQLALLRSMEEQSPAMERLCRPAHGS
jgi:Ser/Thr protein kinase RdoA (MazF antagonist)